CCRSSVPNRQFGPNWQNRISDSSVTVPVLVWAWVVSSSSQFGHERNFENRIRTGSN
ncbi:hypothetical protein K443DRAFT_100366, partial [Laccaria amethystina LaAM-08-1]